MSLFFKKKLIELNESELQNNELFLNKVVSKPNKKVMVVISDTHNAIFLKDGVYINTLSAGKYPILDKGERVDNVEFVYVSKSCKLEVKWATPNRLEMRDPQTDTPIKVGIRGTFEVQINNARKAYDELMGVDKTYNITVLQDKLRSRMCNEIQPIMAKVMDKQNLSYDKIESKDKIAELITPTISDIFSKDYGLKLSSFTIDAIMVGDENTQKPEEK